MTLPGDAWAPRYERLAAEILAGAPAARPLLAGFNIFIDALYPMGADRIQALESFVGCDGGPKGGGPALAEEILTRLRDGRGGALCVNWPAGESWISELLGMPSSLQLGGTGPQAAWALSVIGARSIIALTDRSDEQISVLPRQVAICAGNGTLVSPDQILARTPRRKPRNYILEFVEGTAWPSGRVCRSTRIMLRFLDYGIERDPCFAEAAPAIARRSSGLLISGLDSIPDGDDDSIAWLKRLIADLQARGLPNCHLELAEFPRIGQMHAFASAFGGSIDSVGMSLSELRLLGGTGSPAQIARAVAARHGFPAVFVHADDWALAVHRGPAGHMEGRLLAGNLLASARAFAGQPSSSLALSPDVVFNADIPSAGDLGNGWQADCVPSPYIRRPKATVGLGDTFVAGLMLAAGLEAIAGLPPP